MTTTMERIDRLSTERSKLYREALNGAAGDAEIRRRIAQVSSELDTLWDLRRQERAGQREGIDLLVDRSYEQVYGRDFDDAVAPPRIAEAEEEALTAAA